MASHNVAPLSLSTASLLFFLSDELLAEEEDDNDIFILLSLALHSWPFRVTLPTLHISGLLPSSAEHLFGKGDSDTLEKVCRLDRESFEQLYKSFHVHWLCSLDNPHHQGKHSLWAFSDGRAVLGLVLLWYAHGPDSTVLSLFAGQFYFSVSPFSLIFLFIGRSCAINNLQVFEMGFKCFAWVPLRYSRGHTWSSSSIIFPCNRQCYWSGTWRGNEGMCYCDRWVNSSFRKGWQCSTQLLLWWTSPRLQWLEDCLL